MHLIKLPWPMGIFFFHCSVSHKYCFLEAQLITAEPRDNSVKADDFNINSDMELWYVFFLHLIQERWETSAVIISQKWSTCRDGDVRRHTETCSSVREQCMTILTSRNIDVDSSRGAGKFVLFYAKPTLASLAEKACIRSDWHCPFHQHILATKPYERLGGTKSSHSLLSKQPFVCLTMLETKR